MESDFVRDLLDTWNRLIESGGGVSMEDAECGNCSNALDELHGESAKDHASRESAQRQCGASRGSQHQGVGCWTVHNFHGRSESSTSHACADGEGDVRVAAMSLSNGNYGDTALCHGPPEGSTFTAMQHANVAMSQGDILELDSRPVMTVQPCSAMDSHMTEGADDKKRPLSVSSVSSSVSSSSSLPRHQRKKMATCIVTSQGAPSQGGLNCVDSIEEDYVQNEILHTSVSENISICQKSAEWIANESTENEKDDILGIKTLASENSESSFVSENSIGIARDLTEDYSQNSSSDISDLSNISSTSCHIEDDTKSQKSEKDSCRVKNEDTHKRAVVKPYTPLCDPHGRAPRTTQPSVTTQETLFETARAWSSQTYKVVQEILTTERVYVRDLQDIVQGYVGFLAECEEIVGRLSKQDLQRLFGNITSIHIFNRELLDNLEQCGCDPVKMAQCFVDKKEGFKIYTEYCTNYPSSVEVLTQVMCDSELSDIFKTQQVRLAHGLPLGSFLLKPVQRILKYHLLLQNLLNNFDVRQAGYETVRRALRCMTLVAQHTNEMKRRHERAVHIQEIQSLLFGWAGDDLTTYGELLLEDTFRMHGAKANRHLYLFEKVLIIAKKKEDGNLLVKESIQCSNLMLIESVPKEPLSFHVIPFSNPRMQYTAQARTLEQKHEWCQQIKRLILDNFSAVIPDKAKHLVMTLGKSKEEQEFAESQAEESSAPKKLHTAPEYLERRRHRRKSTTTLLDMSLLQKGQKVFRMRRQSSADGRSPEPTAGGPRLDKKSSSVENMVELVETVQERDEEECELQKAHSIESLHSLEPTSPHSDQTSQHSSPAGHCSAAQSTRRVQSRDLLDALETSKDMSGCTDEPLAMRQSANSPGRLPSSCMVSQRQNEAVTSSRTCKKVPQRDSLLFIDDSDDVLCDNTFLKELSKPSDSLLKAVADCTGIVLPDPGESSTDPVLQRDMENACVILPHLKESRIGSDSNAESDRQALQNSSTCCDSHKIPVNDSTPGSLRKKPPSGVKSSSSKNKLLAADKNVQDRILCDSDISKSLVMLGVRSPSETRLSGESNQSQSPAKNLSSNSDSQISLTSTGAVRVSSDFNKGGSRQHLSDSESAEVNNPWTLRKDLRNRLRRSKDSGQRKRNVDHRRSKSNVGDLPLLKNLIASRQKLERASSCSSLDGKDENGSDAKAQDESHEVQLVSQGGGKDDARQPTQRQVSVEEKSPVVSHKSSPLKKLGGSNSFREKVRNIVTQQRHGKASRYATPPRDVMQAWPGNPGMCEHRQCGPVCSDLEAAEMETALNGSPGKSECPEEADMFDERSAGSKSSTLISRDSSLGDNAQEYMEQEGQAMEVKDKANASKGSLPKRSPRPRSYNDNLQYCVSGHSTPNSAASNDSIMHSLKNAMVSLTSRITRMGNSTNRSAYSSPIHDGSFVRSRSVGAENDARIKPTIIDPLSPQFALARASPPKTVTPPKHSKERRKEKRNKLVYSLQRAYSERVRKRNRTKSVSPTGRRNSKLYLQEQGLLNSTTSIATAERLAEASPQGIGSYTLRKPKTKAAKIKNRGVNRDTAGDASVNYDVDEESESDRRQDDAESSLNLAEDEDLTAVSHQPQGDENQSPSELSNPATPSSVIGAFKHLRSSHTSLRDGFCLPSDVMDLADQSPFEDCISLQSYYENTLEANLDSDVMKASTTFDESGPASFDSDSLVYIPEMPLATVFQTVQDLEEKSGESAIPSLEEVKLAEKTNTIQNIMQNLEMASKSSETQTHEAHKVSVQARTRELKECAMLSRIRQVSCDGSGDSNSCVDSYSCGSDLAAEEKTLVCSCQDGSESLGGDVIKERSSEEIRHNEQSIQNCPVHSSPRKGWVKQVIHQIQSGYLAAEN